MFCVDAMRIVSVSFLFAGANIAFQGIFQALDSGLESLLIYVCRQFLFVLPVAWGFTRIAIKMPNHTRMVWMTFTIAELFFILIAIVLMERINHKKLNMMEA